MFKIEQTPSRHGCRLLSRFTVQSSDGVSLLGLDALASGSAPPCASFVAWQCRALQAQCTTSLSNVVSTARRWPKFVRAPRPFPWSSASAHQAELEARQGALEI